MKALFTYNYGKEEMEKIKELGYEVKIKEEKHLTGHECFNDIEILVCYNPFKTLKIQEMSTLKWIQLSSIGIDQVPVEDLKKQQIILTNNKGGYSIPMGEFIVLKILEFYKNTHGLMAQQRLHHWEMDTSLKEVYHKKVTFIGTGSIALEGAKRLKGFDVKIMGVNTTGKKVEGFDECFSMMEINEVLGVSDVVVLTIPYTTETRNMVGANFLSKMKKDSLLINVSRGGIIDEEALITALDNKWIGGAALDVVKEEPLPKEHRFWGMENVILTPHNSWISEMRNKRRFETIYENLKRYKEKRPLINVVSLEKGY